MLIKATTLGWWHKNSKNITKWVGDREMYWDVEHDLQLLLGFLVFLKELSIPCMLKMIFC